MPRRPKNPADKRRTAVVSMRVNKDTEAWAWEVIEYYKSQGVSFKALVLELISHVEDIPRPEGIINVSAQDVVHLLRRVNAIHAMLKDGRIAIAGMDTEEMQSRLATAHEYNDELIETLDRFSQRQIDLDELDED